MYGFLAAVVLLLLSGITAAILNRFSRLSTLVAVIGSVLACCLGLGAIVPVILGQGTLSFSAKWPVFYGSWALEVDPLSAFFLLPIFILSGLAALYGSEYLKSWFGKKPVGLNWFFYNVLVASMVMVVVARNAILFLAAWEIMSIASFFLVTFEDENPSSRRAGLIYLVATHIGTAFLIALFILLGQQSGSLDFQKFALTDSHLASLVFIFAVVGFGTKAGFIPLHIWLPEAHPAAPSHVSALMSGVMIKTGIYGLVRILTFLGFPLAWWGGLLIAIGLVSGILGVLFALAQHDIKRLLAYHSVENIGIITFGLGLGLLGVSLKLPLLIVFGFLGGLLHVLNHAFFKGLLFLGAGAVAHSTGTREIDHLGGLIKRMPVTALTFLIGSVAISGIPPLNGFVSEFLIYFGAFKGISSGPVACWLGLSIIAGLAMIGGLAAACFTKAFGIIFLGEPRSAHAQQSHEVGWAMRLPMILLSLLCVIIGFFAPVVLILFQRILPLLTSLPYDLLLIEYYEVLAPLTAIMIFAFIFSGLLFFLMGIRFVLLSRRTIEKTVTWDCGYANPSSRMQYTSSSFAQPITGTFQLLLRTSRRLSMSSDIFPQQASWTTKTADLFHKSFYAPFYEKFTRHLLKLRWFQHGRLQFYILYILVTLLVLIVWKLR